ncbi:MAG: hypothetical protein QOG53_436 [Frankiales bacterium]|jgi:uncharacterized OB-fold protein|nr:hypothetical protein [Frankiales bacterium]
MTAPFPHPAPDAETAPFWEGCRRHELLLQNCANCAAWRFPPRPRCPSCRSDEFAWKQVSGQGRIASYTICHPPVLPAYADRVPYNVIVVELAEGPFIISNLMGADPSVDAPVEVTFVDVDDELTLPQFRLV